MVYETRKIIGDESIMISATCIRIPVANCHRARPSVVETESGQVTPDEATFAVRFVPGDRGDGMICRPVIIRCP